MKLSCTTNQVKIRAFAQAHGISVEMLAAGVKDGGIVAKPFASRRQGRAGLVVYSPSERRWSLLGYKDIRESEWTAAKDLLRHFLESKGVYDVNLDQLFDFG